MILVDPAILILLLLSSIVVTASITPAATIVGLLLALLFVTLGRIRGLSCGHWSTTTAIFVSAAGTSTSATTTTTTAASASCLGPVVTSIVAISSAVLAPSTAKLFRFFLCFRH